MKFIKLGIISIVVFYLLIWGISMLFPNVIVISRVTNIAGKSARLKSMLNSNELSYHDWLLPTDSMDVRTSDISFYENNLFNAEPDPRADTIYFQLLNQQKPIVQGGLAFYQLADDSTTTQLFYVFRTRWYKPWEKMAQMANEAKYGPQMDSALLKLKANADRLISKD